VISNISLFATATRTTLNPTQPSVQRVDQRKLPKLQRLQDQSQINGYTRNLKVQDMKGADISGRKKEEIYGRQN
jgi:hypothetical protein